jgi:hypothetical protein
MKYEDWIIRYGAVIRKRFTRNEKLKFLYGISKEFNNMGYVVDVKEAKIGRDTNYNLYVGNINKAKYIVAAYYDTPPSTFGILPYKLFDEKSRRLSIFISSFLPILVLIVLGTLFILKLGSPTWSDGIFGALDIIYTFFLLCIFAIMYRVRDGIGSQTNFVRNTSSIIAILALASSLSSDERKKIAFVLTDYGCKTCAGDKLLSFGVNGRSTIIHLDCIGNTNSLYLFYPKSFSNRVNVIKEDNNLNDICLFDFSKLNKALTFFQENELYLVSASKEGDIFFVRKDRTIKNYFDMNNLEKAVKCLKMLIFQNSN